MYVKTATITNIRSFTELKWNLTSSKLKGWHVIIGDNGAGKSTFLRSIALALCGPKEILGLRENWASWPRTGTENETSSIVLDLEDSKQWDKWAEKGRKLTNYYLSCGFLFKKRSSDDVIVPTKPKYDPKRHVWNNKPGWFSASYGPFRRFTGGDADQKSVFYTHSVLGRHLTVFGENVALTEAVEWLGQLRFEELDQNDSSASLLNEIKQFVNQSGFLPHGVRFEEVTSKGVVFRNPEGFDIDVTRLSDGFRSILSMTFELIRQLVSCYKTTQLFQTSKDGAISIKVPGVVLIDEIDAHLHPTWQRKIGYWLTKHFPEIQFIVTTHSPLICQAAEKGTIFRLPAPGSDQSDYGFVTGVARERLIHGDVLDAYGTELFGKEVNRSDSAKEGLEELAKLNQKKLLKGLTKPEEKRQNLLQKTFSAHSPSAL